MYWPSVPKKWNLKTQLNENSCFPFLTHPAQFLILHKTLTMLLVPVRLCTLSPAARQFLFALQLVHCNLSSFWLSLQLKSCYWRICQPCECHQLQTYYFSIWTAIQYSGNMGGTREFNEVPSHLPEALRRWIHELEHSMKNLKDRKLKLVSIILF